MSNSKITSKLIYTGGQEIRHEDKDNLELTLAPSVLRNKIWINSEKYKALTIKKVKKLHYYCSWIGFVFFGEGDKQISEADVSASGK